MKIDLIKCHGSGNDFLLIDEIEGAVSFTEEERANLAKLLCNRHSKLGADGILFVLNSEQSDARMRVFNADGSEASMCGNGLRCVARYVCEKYHKEEAVIETMKAHLQVKKEEDLYPKIPTYMVEISPVTFEVEDLPLQIEQETLQNEKILSLSDRLSFTALAVPNPHLVSIVEAKDIHSDVQKQLSEYVNGPNPLFPDGVNVSFVKLLQKGAIYVRTFERGVGFTNACGTAMSASSLVTCLNSLNEVEQVIEVYNNGGKVRCVVHEKDSGYSIELIGNATYVYKATIELDEKQLTQFEVIEKQDFDSETLQYKKLEETASEFVRSNM
ncbi:diaminopimelate epimerase [Bacillus sp. V3B]|uniref:diaminopimelate epimerase n=1 Tax=Bacillus sp. V3B TaxID=2804915 RepID=UPI00210E117C|nr:diaminopimelate epimerase [Bacillus sp. V3B]MCQ6276599.1 diaminopimelate epimerase [Bacillus sp. V3B]